jgi:hypothetical protein
MSRMSDVGPSDVRLPASDASDASDVGFSDVGFSDVGFSDVGGPMHARHRRPDVLGGPKREGLSGQL